MTEAKPNHVIKAGRKLAGRYTLINRIATGGMGEVWRARDTMTGVLVAAKVLRPELTGEEISLSRLRLEAQNAMKADHPNIAAVLDSGESDGQGWIVMELVVGKPLVDFVGDGKRLTASELIPILIQVAYALDGSAHAGIVHRDIKPANIMIRDDGLVKLTDFGISYSQGQATLTAVGMVMGTAQYLAPEQAMGAEATLAGDLYSLGIIAYEALAGYRPFTGKTIVDIAMAHVNEPVPALPRDVPSEVADVVYALLEKDPENRYGSGISLVRALNRAADQIGVSPNPQPLKQVADEKVSAPELGAAPNGSQPARTAPGKRSAGRAGQRTASQKPPGTATEKGTLTKAAPAEASRTGSSRGLDQDFSRPRRPRHPGARRPDPTGFVAPAHRRNYTPGPTSGAWKPLEEGKPEVRPRRAIQSRVAGNQPGSRSQTPLWKKPGFWVLFLIGLALVLFVINSYYNAKDTIASSGSGTVSVSSFSSFTSLVLHTEEVKA